MERKNTPSIYCQCDEHDAGHTWGQAGNTAHSIIGQLGAARLLLSLAGSVLWHGGKLGTQHAASLVSLEQQDCC
jgi:hypothetical protein